MNAPEAWWTDRRRADLSATQLRSPPAALIETIIRWAAARSLAHSLRRACYVFFTQPAHLMREKFGLFIDKKIMLEQRNAGGRCANIRIGVGRSPNFRRGDPRVGQNLNKISELPSFGLQLANVAIEKSELDLDTLS